MTRVKIDGDKLDLFLLRSTLLEITETPAGMRKRLHAPKLASSRRPGGRRQVDPVRVNLHMGWGATGVVLSRAESHLPIESLHLLCLMREEAGLRVTAQVTHFPFHLTPLCLLGAKVPFVIRYMAYVPPREDVKLLNLIRDKSDDFKC